MTPPGIAEWIIYARISDDREGAGLGVDRQVKDARTHFERAGLPGEIIAVLVDNDMTANDRSGRYKPRPDYNRLCHMLAERPGRRGVITWHTDRLHRTPRELEDFIELVERTAGTVQTVKAGHIDLATPSGRMIARQLCAVARYESEHKAERIRAKVAELAAAGSIYGGGPRPFGYTRIYEGVGTRRRILRDEINPEEAVVVRECARRVLAGHSLRSVRQWLDGEGVTTSTGRPWSQQGLRYMLMSGRIAGLRDHLRQVVGKAVWEPIITVEEHQQLRVVLAAKKRFEQDGVRKYYLTGFVWCGDCMVKGIKMGVGYAHGKAKYRCPPDQGGCNGRSIGIAELEAHVDEILVSVMADPRVLSRIAAREANTGTVVRDVLDRIAADEQRMALMKAALDGLGDVDAIPEVVASMAAIRVRIVRAREQLAGLGVAPAAALDLPGLAARWDRAGLAEKRTALGLFVEKIVILPAVRGRGFFDPGRVQVVPVDPEG